jgi:uncharacterized membrane protein (UPF0127 family)
VSGPYPNRLERERVLGTRYRPLVRSCVAVSGARRVPVGVAETPFERFRGLIGAGPPRGLLLPRTRSIHTIGMRAPIDAVLLDAGGTVVAVVRVTPGRLLLPRRRVRAVLELWGSPFVPGDVVRIEDDQVGPPPGAVASV